MTEHTTAEEALVELKAGNEAFVQSLRHAGPLLNRLARDQKPLASVLSCADSRTAPEILFNQGLGDIFAIRVAGNVATQIERASLEFSATVLKSPLIVVMGHTGCGAVKAALELLGGKKFPGDIQALASLISPAARETQDLPGDWLENAIHENVRMSIASLTASSVLSNLSDSGALKIVGAYYELESGRVIFL